MVCVAIDVARGAVPLDFITNKALSNKESIALNVAPAQGLFLEMSYFEEYNHRKNTEQKNNPQGDLLLDLNWSDAINNNNPAKERCAAFGNVVRKHIFEEEMDQSNFIQYLFL